MRAQTLSRWLPTALALFIVSAASVLAGDQDRDHRPDPVPHVVVDRAATFERVDAALADVEILAELTHAQRDERNLRRIDRRLQHLREHLGDIRASARYGPTVELRVRGNDRPRRVRREVMSDDRFAHLMRQLDDATFERRQLPIVADIVRDHWFTSEQVLAVVKELDNAGGVEAGALMYPRVVDPADFFLVYDAFTFDSDATDLRKRVRKLRDSQK